MEYLKLAELLSRIDSAIANDDSTKALRLVLSNFSKLPDPAPLRQRAATVLADVGRREAAAEIYERTALHWANAGHPTRALATIKRLAELGGDTATTLDRFTALYNVKSPFLGEQRHATVDGPTSPLDLHGSEPQLSGDTLFEIAAERALETGSYRTEPGDLPPVSLLSQMPSEKLRATVDALELEVFEQMGAALPVDEIPDSLVWTVTPDVTLGDDDPTYRLPSGSLLGLNGFGLTPLPMQTRVVARSGSELLRLPADAINMLIDRFGDFADRLANINRHAFTESLLERHALLEAVPADRRRDLLGRFDGLKLDRGAHVIEQGTNSPGLFLILDGRADIIRRDEDWEITIATLGPGELFGEVGLVSDRETQANVQMIEPGHLLFLPNRAFEDAATEHPGLAKFMVNLARRRIEEVESTLTATDLSEISE